MNKLLIFLLFFTYNLYSVPSITIFVHGSQNATKWLSKDIWYCQQGLHHINELPNSSCFVQDAKILAQKDPQLFNLEHYYTFGWPGFVNFTVRKQAGEQLYYALQALVQKYKKEYGVNPVVRMITHSHGGNIALNMLNHFPLNKGVSVELDLIILACPVQKVTESLIEHPAIKHSYVIYSTRDLIQCLDLYTYQGRYYFPKRTFATNTKRCTQVLVRVNGCKLTHTDFAHSFIRHIPEVMQAAKDKSGCMEHNVIDPGFIFYNGFNIMTAMKGQRREIEHILAY